MSIVDKLTLSCKEEKAIEEFEMRMKNSLTQSMREDEKNIYYRFLKARDFDVDKAEKMLRKHLEWRKIYQIETILEDFKPTEVFLKYPEPSVIGFDKDGDIVRYSPAGTFSPVEIMKCFTNHVYMKHWFWFAENTARLLKEENKKTGKKGYLCTVIFDLDKLLFATVTSRVALDMILRFIHAYQDNYPERMKNAFIINAPPYFVMFFSIVKTVMSVAMLRKIHIFGSTGWKEKLLEKFDADILPAFLGGNRTDPDGNPECKTFINRGGKIPDRYYLTDEERYFTDATRVKRLLISPTEKEEIHVELNQLGSLLQWEFSVKGKDIGFGIYFEPSEFKVTELIPIQRYDTSDGAVKDSLKCRAIGRYVIVFDNSYSWLNSKEIQYCIRVVEPIL